MNQFFLLSAHLLRVQISSSGTYYILGAFWLLLAYIFSLSMVQVRQANIIPVFWWAGFSSLFLIPILCLNTYLKGSVDNFFTLQRTLGISTASITLGYFVQRVVLLLLLDSILAIQYGFLVLYGSPDHGLHTCAFLGLLCLQMAYLSVSLFVSSLSKDRILTMMTSVGLLLGLWLLSYANQLFSGILTPLGQILRKGSLYYPFSHFLSGAFYPTELLSLCIWIFFPLWLCSIQGKR
jgi:hypothetical protein